MPKGHWKCRGIKQQRKVVFFYKQYICSVCESCTGYSFSEARVHASINPKVDVRFFIDSTVGVHVDYTKSYVYFWINWCKNESFWKSITCIIMIPSIGTNSNERIWSNLLQWFKIQPNDNLRRIFWTINVFIWRFF